MVTFCISLIALVLGYLLYGRFVDSVFGPDDRATQSPLMARCLASERKGRAVFYGSMITEGLVALVWAAVSMYFFYGEPAPGYQLIEAGGVCLVIAAVWFCAWMINNNKNQRK